jgi:hypothetical protein
MQAMTSVQLNARIDFDQKVRKTEADLGRRLTGRERSALFSKAAPKFYIAQPPVPRPAHEITDADRARIARAEEKRARKARRN